jgi:hypothetical protein
MAVTVIKLMKILHHMRFTRRQPAPLGFPSAFFDLFLAKQIAGATR